MAGGPPPLAEGEQAVDGFTVSTRVVEPSLEHLADPARLKQLNVTIAWMVEQQPRQLLFVTYLRCEVS
jgi:hypothetical protein